MPDATAIGRVTDAVMRRHRPAAAVILVLAVAATLTGAVVSARQSSPATNDEVLPALLAEVKGLRAAMEQMASAGPRVQLFVGRLQLQEARITSMARRLDTVRDSLAGAQPHYENTRQRFKELQSAMAENREGLPPRAELESLLANRRSEVSAAKTAVDRLTAEEAQLGQDLTVEQGRWTEINQRLDELERALIKR
jgi:predicted nuclease with TOPRIM domain